MAKKARFRHLRGSSAYYPYAARTHLRKRQRRTARWLRVFGCALLAAAAALVVRQTWLRGGQPAPPPTVTAAPLPTAAVPAPAAPVPVAVHPATADVEQDVLARTAQADAEAHAAPAPEPTPAPQAEVLPVYRELYAQNPDLVGWLRIDGTDIDYPVVQAAGDNDYYLRRGFDRLYALGGTLFLDARCRLGFGSDRPTVNWLVYGHNMADGSMFGTLARYTDRDFWAGHPTFTFDTLYESGTWQVAAVLRTELGIDELPYYAFFDASDRETWQTWMDAILPRALYDTGVVPQYGDQLLTLSTCGDTDPGTTARLAVLAVRADP